MLCRKHSIGMKRSELYLVIFFIFIIMQSGYTQTILSDAVNMENSTVYRIAKPILLQVDLDNPYYIISDRLPRFFEYDKKNRKYINDFSSCVKELRDTSKYKKLSDRQKDLIASIEFYRKYYKSAPVKFEDCTFFNPASHGADYLVSSGRNYIMPEAFRFYSTPLGDTIISGCYRMKVRLNKPLAEILMPFYFKKTCITNKEYREFVNYVRDSIVRTKLYNAGDKKMVYHKNKYDTVPDPPILNWKTKINFNDTNVQKNLADLFIPVNNRFYKRKEWDTRKFKYGYNGDRNTYYMINIYPDTLDWILDFPYSFNEVMTNMYFWHPAFDDYPVVGISRNQAEAFLHWKTEQEQKKLNRKGKVKWIIKYELPAEYEWEMVESADVENGVPVVYPDYFKYMSDYSYITDLMFKPDLYGTKVIFHNSKDYDILLDSLGKPKDSLRNYWKRQRIVHALNSNFFCSSWNIRMNEPGCNNNQILPADAKLTPKNPLLIGGCDCNHISYMGSNVSEWLKETYTGNYKVMYDYRQRLMEKLTGNDIKMLAGLEDYFNRENDTGSSVFWNNIATLVRESNWFDDRPSGKAGKNTDGMNAKRFVNSDTTSCTIGFRYVIKLYRKDENQIISSFRKNP